MKCSKCKRDQESTCPCTVTTIGSMQVEKLVNVPSPLANSGMMQTKVRQDVPVPFTTTIFICIGCNTERLHIELNKGPMNCLQLRDWLEETPSESADKVLPFNPRQAS